ncbi:hypothetical protein TNCV_1001761 [Trichonephila clavipes]|nr:hypothetical protein TNCV_1001761 [Trichonephila clavipes]
MCRLGGLEVACPPRMRKSCHMIMSNVKDPLIQCSDCGDRWCRHRPFGEFRRAKSYCTCMVLKANDRRTSSTLPRGISWVSI